MPSSHHVLIPQITPQLQPSHSVTQPRLCKPLSDSLSQVITVESAMEEVWKEIKLASLCDCSNNSLLSSNATAHSACPNLVFHEFFNKHSNSPARDRASAVFNPASAADSTFAAFLEPSQPAILSLSPAGSDPHKQSKESFLTSSSTPSDAGLDSPPICASNSNKRALEDSNNSGDRRHKRMMKNRESAARSRARKQAYTNELELEVAHLKEENARLRKQQEKLLLTSSAQHSKKYTLYRTLTAPF